MAICKTVKDLNETIKHCVYQRNTDVHGNYEYVCNFCGQSFEFWDEAIIHVTDVHEKETIPDVDPTK